MGDQAGAHTPEHDPAPWFEDEACICSSIGPVCIIAYPDKWAGVDENDIPAEVHARVSHNARLIASAPAMAEELERLREVNAQMLEALQLTIPILEADYADFGPLEPESRALLKCRAAILAAEGNRTDGARAMVEEVP